MNRPPSLPEGGICLPPPHAEKKLRLERAACDRLASLGFSPIELPLIEGLSSQDPASDERCKILAPDGSLLGLRQDHTTSVIRYVASQENFRLPARLFYVGSVFRRKKNFGGYVEVAQVGAEILGDEGTEADIEILRALGQTLDAVGVRDYLIDVGTVEVFKGLVAQTKIDAHIMGSIREAIARKDISELRRVLAVAGLPEPKRKALESLPNLFGGRDVIDRALAESDNERSRGALDSLKQIHAALSLPASQGGIADRISIDLGVVQSLDYYTGIVFEALTSRVGEPIASGGRYDRLGDAFGRSITATGFALNIAPLLEIAP